MFKGEVATRTLYPENPQTAGHAVNGTQVTILAIDTDGRCRVGDSPVKWDAAIGKNTYQPVFEHYENHDYTYEQALEVVKGKLVKLMADGYVYEPVPDMELFIQTGKWVIEVVKHPKSGSTVC